MSNLSGDISALTFKGAIRGQLGEFSLDSSMLSVLMELDGHKDCATVSRKLKISLGELRRVLEALDRLTLLEQVGAAASWMEPAFFKALRGHLSQAMGPIAEILIEDELGELGVSADRFPRHQAADLVAALARQIPRNEKRIAFQQAMIKEIKQAAR
jgi:hypothetical protein